MILQKYYFANQYKYMSKNIITSFMISNRIHIIHSAQFSSYTSYKHVLSRLGLMPRRVIEESLNYSHAGQN